jgi:hypothetical protein
MVSVLQMQCQSLAGGVNWAVLRVAVPVRRRVARTVDIKTARCLADKLLGEWVERCVERETELVNERAPY